MQLTLGDAAADVVVADRGGAAVQLATLWENGPLALFFVRHFG